MSGVWIDFMFSYLQQQVPTTAPVLSAKTSRFKVTPVKEESPLPEGIGQSDVQAVSGGPPQDHIQQPQTASQNQESTQQDLNVQGIVYDASHSQDVEKQNVHPLETMYPPTVASEHQQKPPFIENLETSQQGTPEMTLLPGEGKRGILAQGSVDKDKTDRFENCCIEAAEFSKLDEIYLYFSGPFTFEDLQQKLQMVTHPPQPAASSGSSTAELTSNQQFKDEPLTQQTHENTTDKPVEIKSIRRGRFSVVTHKPEEIEEIVPLTEMGHPHPDMSSQTNAFNATNGGRVGVPGPEAYFSQNQQYFQQQYPHPQYVTPIPPQGFIPASFSPAPGAPSVQVGLTRLTFRFLLNLRQFYCFGFMH